jgi:hypothetical protein
MYSTAYSLTIVFLATCSIINGMDMNRHNTSSSLPWSRPNEIYISPVLLKDRKLSIKLYPASSKAPSNGKQHIIQKKLKNFSTMVDKDRNLAN